VVLLGKDMPFPAKCALPWPNSGAPRVTKFTSVVSTLKNRLVCAMDDLQKVMFNKKIDTRLI
jgi:hypothetical protein